LTDGPSKCGEARHRADGGRASGVYVWRRRQPPNSKASPATQSEKRNPAAVREATIASILDQANFVLGGVRLNAEIAQQFAGAGDQRGFLYALDQTVRHAIRAGAEGVELRKIRAKMRGEAASSNEGRP
jgi:hypothetical protein